MTNYLSLFKKTQKIIFDLGNLVDDTYTAAFNVTLTSVYFTAVESAAPADLVLAVSSGRSAFDSPSVWTVPPENASKLLILPSNTARAVFTIAATGQSAEEVRDMREILRNFVNTMQFWWSNVLELETGTFPQYGALNGYSPFREVQLLIDGRLAGVVWPFPIIFTGGVVPGLWRPVVGIDAFDLKEDEIDITPWLPLLCDDKPHNFTIRIAGLVDTSDGSAQLSETTDNYWLVSGKVICCEKRPRVLLINPDFYLARHCESYHDWDRPSGRSLSAVAGNLILRRRGNQRHQRDALLPGKRSSPALDHVHCPYIARREKSKLAAASELHQSWQLYKGGKRASQSTTHTGT